MNIFEAFELMSAGHIVEDNYGYWFKREGDKLFDSGSDGRTWYETEEFKFGYINQEWHLVR